MEMDQDQHMCQGIGCACLKKDSKYPVLIAAVDRETGNWNVWCPYCKDWHQHCPEPGHRIAHCDDDSGSPFLETGYVVKLNASSVEYKKRKSQRRPSRKCGQISQKLRFFILKRDKFKCQYCGASAETIDHMVSDYDGGKTVPENLVAACWPCNVGKGKTSIYPGQLKRRK
jgi:5-methylcytosine-specific restriction endonuclease McrA